MVKNSLKKKIDGTKMHFVCALLKHCCSGQRQNRNKPFFRALRALTSLTGADGLTISSPVSLPLDCSLAVESASDGETL